MTPRAGRFRFLHSFHRPRAGGGFNQTANARLLAKRFLSRLVTLVRPQICAATMRLRNAGDFRQHDLAENASLSHIRPFTGNSSPKSDDPGETAVAHWKSDYRRPSETGQYRPRAPNDAIGGITTAVHRRQLGQVCFADVADFRSGREEWTTRRPLPGKSDAHLRNLRISSFPASCWRWQTYPSFSSR